MKNQILVIIKEQTHQKLWGYKIKNRCRSLNDAVEKLLQEDEQQSSNTK